MAKNVSELQALLTVNIVSEGIPIIIGIDLFEGSTSDEAYASKGVARQDLIFGIPFLQICISSGNSEINQRVDKSFIYLQNMALQSKKLSDGRIPLVQHPQKKIYFSLIGSDKISLRSESGPIGLLQQEYFHIDERLGWFLAKCGTLSIRLVDATAEEIWCTTAFEKPDIPPHILNHAGNLSQRNIETIINRSQSWDASILGNPSLFADAEDLADDHFDIYASFKNKGSIIPAKLNHVGGCIACEKEANSNEHCTPNWVATDQGVQPVTSVLFCKECNNYFGEALEVKISELYKNGDLASVASGQDSIIFNLWAIKTALTLTVASGGRINREWMKLIRELKIPDGFEIYALHDVQILDPGYMYGVTIFSADRHSKGYFLFSFCTSNLTFVVVRAESSIGNFGTLPRIYPSYLPPVTPRQSNIDITEIHGKLLTQITGTPNIFTSRAVYKPQSRK